MKENNLNGIFGCQLCVFVSGGVPVISLSSVDELKFISRVSLGTCPVTVWEGMPLSMGVSPVLTLFHIFPKNRKSND